jgi:hypothetical protein
VRREELDLSLAADLDLGGDIDDDDMQSAEDVPRLMVEEDDEEELDFFSDEVDAAFDNWQEEAMTTTASSGSNTFCSKCHKGEVYFQKQNITSTSGKK